MEFQRINKSDPERIFMSFYNSYSTASFTSGQWAAHDLVTDGDGVSVTKPGGANRNMLAGCANGTIASAAYGLFQVWGYRADARCKGGSGLGTSKISAATPLVMKTSGFAAQARANISADVKADYGARACAFAVGPANTAAIATQAATSGAYKVMITCL